MVGNYQHPTSHNLSCGLILGAVGLRTLALLSIPTNLCLPCANTKTLRFRTKRSW